jgi:hypothetical protein
MKIYFRILNQGGNFIGYSAEKIEAVIKTVKSPLSPTYWVSAKRASGELIYILIHNNYPKAKETLLSVKTRGFVDISLGVARKHEIAMYAPTWGQTGA